MQLKDAIRFFKNMCDTAKSSEILFGEKQNVKIGTTTAIAIDKVLKELNDRVPSKVVNELVADYENQLTEKNNYIFNLESEREALWNKLDEEFE